MRSILKQTIPLLWPHTFLKICMDLVIKKGPLHNTTTYIRHKKNLHILYINTYALTQYGSNMNSHVLPVCTFHSQLCMTYAVLCLDLEHGRMRCVKMIVFNGTCDTRLFGCSNLVPMHVNVMFWSQREIAHQGPCMSEFFPFLITSQNSTTIDFNFLINY